LEARREGRPIGEPGADAIAVNRTLGGGPPDEVARRAAEGMRDGGFACFKLKVGLPDDEERVAAVRGAIGSWPALRIDANGARSAIAAARELGLEPYLSSTLDGPWGIAAALQLAASERLSLACGLATLELFDAELARVLPGPQKGLLPVPQGPGLGVAVDDGL